MTSHETAPSQSAARRPHCANVHADENGSTPHNISLSGLAFKVREHKVNAGERIDFEGRKIRKTMDRNWLDHCCSMKVKIFR